MAGGLTVLTFWWGDRYTPAYVERLAAGLRKHLQQPHRLICVHGRGLTVPAGIETRPISDPGLCTIPGCFARLRAFDPAWQEDIGIYRRGARIVWLDLDLIITGPLDPLFDRDEDLLILQGANASNPCPYNGSVLMLRAGTHREIWDTFSPYAARRVPFYSFPDDQGWIWHMARNLPGWRAGPDSGIYAFRKPGWPGGVDLPAGARIVCFPGGRDPADFEHLPWVQEHWIGA
jgi:hypothetical protein